MQKLVSIVVVLSLFSCSQECVGGRGKIIGYIEKQIINRNNTAVDTVPASDKKVYIIYGDESCYNDKAVTNTDGYLEFDFLTKGDYKIYANNDCDSGKELTLNNVEIKSKGDEVLISLSIRKIVDYDDGSSVIKGRFMEQLYVGLFPANSPYVSQKNEVFISNGTDEVYFDDIDTGFDGKFEFRNLIKWTYRVYAYSESATCTDVLDIVSYAVIIGRNYQGISVGDLTIEKH
jgi:hypothetical protein